MQVPYQGLNDTKDTHTNIACRQLRLMPKLCFISLCPNWIFVSTITVTGITLGYFFTLMSSTIYRGNNVLPVANWSIKKDTYNCLSIFILTRNCLTIYSTNNLTLMDTVNNLWHPKLIRIDINFVLYIYIYMYMYMYYVM